MASAFTIAPVESLPNEAEKLKTLYGTRNLQELAGAAHSLKGAGGCFGFAEITELSATLERSIREGKPLNVIEVHTNTLVARLEEAHRTRE